MRGRRARDRRRTAMTASDSQPDAASAALTTIGGRYDVDLARPIATGGLCHVYRGRDRRTKAEVAVRTLRAEYRNDPETRARFRREARLLAFLKHPNIVRVEAFVEERGASWAVMELLDGGSVRDLIDREAPMSPESVSPVLEQAAAGLGHIHARGLVHLDVKPQNLLFAGDGRTVKLIDLGLAQPAGKPQEAMGGRTFATAAYLSPEQACGDPVEPASDVYALGCVVHEMLAGLPPFVHPQRGQTLNDVVTARLSGDAPRVSASLPAGSLPPWVDDVLHWSLARDPRARYADAHTFARLFRSGIEGDLTGQQLDVPPPLDAETRPADRQDRQWVEDRPRRSLPGGGTVVDRGGNVAEVPREPRFARLARWLWIAAAALLALNLALAGALLARDGAVPPFRAEVAGLRAGGEATVAVDGVLVRAEPSEAATALGQLPAGNRVRLDGPPVAEGGREWWPVVFGLEGGEVTGWVAGEWLAP